MCPRLGPTKLDWAAKDWCVVNNKGGHVSTFDISLKKIFNKDFQEAGDGASSFSCLPLFPIFPNVKAPSKAFYFSKSIQKIKMNIIAKTKDIMEIT